MATGYSWTGKIKDEVPECWDDWNLVEVAVVHTNLRARSPVVWTSVGLGLGAGALLLAASGVSVPVISTAAILASGKFPIPYIVSTLCNNFNKQNYRPSFFWDFHSTGGRMLTDF